MKSFTLALLLLSSLRQTSSNESYQNEYFGSNATSEVIKKIQLNEELSLNLHRSVELPITLTLAPTNSDKVIADTYRETRKGFLKTNRAFLENCENQALAVLLPLLSDSESSVSKYLKKIGAEGSKFSWIHIGQHIDLYESKDLVISRPLANRVGSTVAGQTYGYSLALKIGYKRTEKNKRVLHCEIPSAEQINLASEDCLAKFPNDLNCLN